MKSKLLQIPYTIGVVKPHMVLQRQQMEKFHEDLDKNHFEIFHQVKKILTSEEVLNLFYTHRNASYYPEIHEHMTTSESIVMLLVNSTDKVENPEDPDGEEIKLEAPVKRWKALLGNKDPEQAKELGGLRGIYGKDLIMNGFHGADDPKAANKERDVFLFPIPERPPEFEYIRTKVSMDTIFQFLFPPNLEHANSTGRLDLFAMYGPIVNYHSVDYCFCSSCLPVAKGQLQIAIKEKEESERRKSGMTAANGAKLGATGQAGGIKPQKLSMTVRKLADAPMRLLKESDLEEIFPDLCEKCQKHCDSFVHLPCGRGGQHLNSDIEIDTLIKEVNYQDLLALLIVEKGSTAKIMMETLDLHEPHEIMYTREHVDELLKPLETDYYGRYEFNDLQKMILEDRRLRMNYWISKITHKPIEKFKNPNLLNVNEKVDRKDIKNPYFSLSRILPISLHMEKHKDIRTDKTYDKLHFDFKGTYQQNEQDQIIERQIGKELHRLCNVDQAKQSGFTQNTLLMRNYNDGRHGGWNNYVSYKGSGVGSYVNKNKK